MSAKVKIKVGDVFVIKESTELSSSDEPYVIVFVADVAKNQFGFTVPNGRTTMFDWVDADAGETLNTIMDDSPLANFPFIRTSEYCWGPNGKATVVNSADDLIILAGVMENDDGSPSAGRALVNGIMAGSLANMVGANLSRDEMAKRLKNDMDGALTQARITGAPDFDDRVGPVKELRLTSADLNQAKTSNVSKSLLFDATNTGDGAYRVDFVIMPG